jgi:hypothetical protein
MGRGMSAIGGNPSGGAAAVTMPALNLLFAQRAADDAANVVRTPGGDNVSIGFTAVALQAITVRGIRAYFKPGGAVVHLRLSLWDGAGARLAFVDVDTTTADGTVTGSFGSAVALARCSAFGVTCYDKSGATWCKWAFTSPPLSSINVATKTRGILAGPAVQIDMFGAYGAGDTFPAPPTQSDGYAATCEPIIDGISL